MTDAPSVIWSWPIQLEVLRNGRVQLIKPVVYYFKGCPVERWSVPKHFRFDGASVPELLKSATPNKFQTIAAAIFHDHWVSRFPVGTQRLVGDDLFRLILETEGHGSDAEWAARRMHWAVRLYSRIFRA